MKVVSKDEILTIIAVVILIFTALINWTVYSWLVLLAVIVLLLAWYVRE
jgi:hypothetical protein